jgi:hypothetical protein
MLTFCSSGLIDVVDEHAAIHEPLSGLRRSKHGKLNLEHLGFECSILSALRTHPLRFCFIT